MPPKKKLFKGKLPSQKEIAALVKKHETIIKTWLNDDVEFQPHVQRLFTLVDQEKLENAIKNDTSKPRGPNYSAILDTLKDRKRDFERAKSRQSRNRPLEGDTEGDEWDELDHWAYCLWNIKVDAMGGYGIFSDAQYPDATINDAIYMGMLFVRDTMTTKERDRLKKEKLERGPVGGKENADLFGRGSNLLAPNRDSEGSSRLPLHEVIRQKQEGLLQKARQADDDGGDDLGASSKHKVSPMPQTEQPAPKKPFQGREEDANESHKTTETAPVGLGLLSSDPDQMLIQFGRVSISPELLQAEFGSKPQPGQLGGKRLPPQPVPTSPDDQQHGDEGPESFRPQPGQLGGKRLPPQPVPTSPDDQQHDDEGPESFRPQPGQLGGKRLPPQPVPTSPDDQQHDDEGPESFRPQPGQLGGKRLPPQPVPTSPDDHQHEDEDIYNPEYDSNVEDGDTLLMGENGEVKMIMKAQVKKTEHQNSAYRPIEDPNDPEVQADLQVKAEDGPNGDVTRALEDIYRNADVEENVTQAYYQRRRIKQVLKGYKPKSEKLAEEEAQRLMVNPESMAVESWTWRRWGQIQREISPDEAVVDDDTPCANIAEATPEDLAMHRKNEEILDNPAYQRDNHAEACEALGIEDPECPIMPGMDRLQHLYHWQPVCINAIVEFEKKGLSGCILADEIGMGKTREVAGYLLHRLNKRRDLLKAKNDDPSIDIPRAKPVLIECPANVLEQWKDEIKLMAPGMFTIKIYHGDSRERGGSSSKMSLLSKDHPVFNGQERNFNTLILTTYKTMAIRHGPGKRRKELMKSLLPTIPDIKQRRRAAKELAVDRDPDWKCGLFGCFDLGVFDEAHALKNPRTDTSITVQWLGLSFHVLVTATPCSNRIDDFLGLLEFIQPKWDWAAKMDEWGWSQPRFDGQNPYDLNLLNPGAILMLQPDRYKKYVLTKKKSVDMYDKGKALGKAFALCMIRRTYASVVSGKSIMDSLPGLHMQQILVEFTKMEQEQYIEFTKDARAKLIKIDPVTKKPVWNMLHFRTLVTAATWLGFGEPALLEILDTKSNVDWLKTKNLLYTWLRKIDRHITDDPEDWKTQVAMALSGSPKMRAMLAIFADTVVLRGDKALIYCASPRSQMYVHEVLRLLGLDAHLFTSNLTQKQRGELVSRFNKPHIPGQPDSCQILICSFQVNCCGLNLQKSCHHVHLWDPPPSEPLGRQAIGRAYRVGQKWVVSVWTYFVSNSFNQDQVNGNARKMGPILIAMMDSADFGADLVNFPLGKWLEHEGKYVHARVLRSQGIAVDPNKFIDSDKVLEHILAGLRGELVDIVFPEDGLSLENDGSEQQDEGPEQPDDASEQQDDEPEQQDDEPEQQEDVLEPEDD